MNLESIEGLREEQIQNIMDEYILLSGECGCFTNRFNSNCMCYDSGSNNPYCNDSPVNESDCQARCFSICRNITCYRFYSSYVSPMFAYQTFCRKM